MARTNPRRGPRRGPLDPVVRVDIICMMTQVRTRRPFSPKQAASCCGPIDDLLDPDLFKALCDPTRARLMGCLIKCGRSCTVSEMADCCSVDFSVVSRHLQLLERAGILESVKASRTVSYTVRYDHLCRALRSLANAIEDCCPCDRPCDAPCACAVSGRSHVKRKGTKR